MSVDVWMLDWGSREEMSQLLNLVLGSDGGRERV